MITSDFNFEDSPALLVPGFCKVMLPKGLYIIISRVLNEKYTAGSRIIHTQIFVHSNCLI